MPPTLKARPPRSDSGTAVSIIDPPALALPLPADALTTSESKVARRRRVRLYPFEWLALGVTAIGMAVAPWSPVEPMKLAPGRVAEGLGIAFTIVLTLRLIVPLGRWWRNRRTLPEGELLRMVRSAYRIEYVAYVLRAALSIQLVLLWFCSMKYAVPYFRPELFDEPLWRLDAWMHGGASPSELAVAATKGIPALLHAVDVYYVGYFPILVLFFTYMMIQERRPDLRDRFVFGYCAFWFLGGLLYYLWPSMGPIYYRPDLFAGVVRHMPAANVLQRGLLSDYLAFRASPWTHEPILYYGIAAMPSLHVGACAMFAAFARRMGRTPFVIMVTATLLMLVCSVITGWHYAVDGYAGAALGWACYAIAMRRRLAATRQGSARRSCLATEPPEEIRCPHQADNT